MPLTHILVDYENTKPSAEDVALLRDEAQHLWICRGPNEKKYDAEFFEALHALGARLHFVKCAKSGRNALDMHIAFQMGFLMGEARQAKGEPPFAFVVVSRDTDYEPLLLYIRSLGCSAARARNVREALGAAPVEKAPVAKAPAARTARTKAAPTPAPAKTVAPPAKRAAAARTKPAKKAPAARAAKSSARSGVAKAAAKAAHAPAPSAAASAAPLDELVDKVVDHLQTHPRNRPTRRDKLQSLVQSHLRTRLAGADVSDIVERLERRGVVRFAGNKIEYPQWT